MPPKALFKLQLLLVCFGAFCSSCPPIFHKYFFIPTIYWALNIILKSVNERSGGKKTDCQSTDCVFSLRNHSCKEEQQKKSLLKTTIWGKKWFYLTLAWMSFDLFVLYFLKVWSQITYIFILIDIHVTIFPCFLKQFYFLDLSIWNQKLEGLCC